MKLGVKVVFVILSVLVLTDACFAFGPAMTKRERMKREAQLTGRPSTDFYEKIHEYFLKEDYAQAERTANQFLSTQPNQDKASKAQYLQALSLLKLGRYDEARQKLYALKNSDGKYEPSVAVSVADSYFLEGNHRMALLKYKEATDHYSFHDEAPYVLERIQELGQKIPGNEVVAATASALNQMGFEEKPLFSVQVGSFSSRSNAHSLMRKLENKQYSAYIEQEENMFRVRVGKFLSKKEAVRLSERLNEEGYPTKIYP